LAVLSPLLERKTDHGDAITDSELHADLQIGVCRLASYRSDRKSIVGLFAYPGLLLVGLIGVVVLFSQFVAPSIGSFLVEFGIETPVSTKVLLGFCSFLKAAWLVPIVCVLVAMLPIIIEFMRSAGWVPSLVQWVDDRLSGRRTEVAMWARHTALLLQAGVDSRSSVETSMLSAKRWLRSRKIPWRFGLLEEVLRLDDRSAKIALLNQTADYYHCHRRNWVQWWASFLPMILICFMGAVFVFVIGSLLMPLVSVISGLSGGMF